MTSIPFNRPSLAGREMEYIQDALRVGHSSGDGPYTRRCRELLEKLLGVPKVILTTSCTHALEMAGLLLGLEPGDEVIVPGYTFVASLSSIVHARAVPVRSSPWMVAMPG
jgi:dTDP-4-amino-4,6-dideoxygalactose transaminase